MSAGESIRIDNANSTVRILWEGPAARRFAFKDLEWTETMTVRDSRWYGALGIYSAGLSMFARSGDVRRMVYSEAMRDFASEQELVEFLNGHWNKNVIQYVWSEEGLVGGLVQSPERYQLSVNLWRVTVQGRVPDYFARHPTTQGSVTWE